MSLELIKGAVDSIGKNFEEFKHAADQSRKEQDALLEDKIKKIAEDITSKHELVQRELNALQAKAQRPAQSEAELSAAQKNAEFFAKMRRDTQYPVRGGSVNEYAPNVEQLAAYEKAFTQYMRIDKDGLEPDVRKDLSVGSDPDGGYWVLPPTIAQNVIKKVFETSPMRQVASVMTIGTREYVIPEDPNDVGAGWVAERGPITTSSTMQVQRRVITACEEYAEPVITTQMLEDSMIDIEAYLGTKISDKIARLENTAFVNGTGSGQPRGLLTYSSGTTWGSTIEQVGSGSSGAFTYLGLVNLVTSIKDKFQGNASFLIRRQSVASIMTLVDASNRLIFQPLLNGAFNQTPLLGYQINYAADVPAVGAGALALVFGDFKSGYQIVDRVGMSTIRDNLTSKPNVLFYTRKRVGGDVIDFDAFKIQVLS
jgi:HK97 family phage major capsid protein